jgi:NAD(P)-dependent dehydrogenase (short-subunit alcohol dehydrogenase family)
MNKKIMLITGASRGIGASTALLAAEQGYRVCINYRYNQQSAENLVQQIRQSGGDACAIQADISQEQQVVTLFQQLDQQMGTISALVNNAGILETQTTLENLDAARLQRVFQTNVFGSFLCAREAVKRMSTDHGGKGGSIVNVSSAASRLGSANEYIDYAASKGAIDSMTIGLSKEVAEQGIRVNAVRPGFIYTEMHADGGEPGRVDRVKSMVPMKRGGHPEEVANAILWLLSDQASYITGSFIDIAGGR